MSLNCGTALCAVNSYVGVGLVLIAPAIFPTAFGIVKHLIDENTLSTLVVLGGEC